VNFSSINNGLQSVARAARERAGFPVGMGQQAINTVMERILPSCRDTDLIVSQGVGTQAGAAFVRNRLAPAATAVDYSALRSQRPLLAETAVDVSDGAATTRVEFNAVAPGTDFGIEGKEASMLSVYVNGTYHSDVAVLSERPPRYSVNLGTLGTGSHSIELRAAKDLSKPHEALPISVSDVTTRNLTGDEALVDRYAPVLETRWTPGSPRIPAVHTDIPLLTVPKIEELPDGRKRITYYMMFSHEDGGTPVTRAFRMFGRSADYERAYHVDLDAAGNLVRERYQAPMHVPREFRGSHTDGTRPVLRVATPNNLFTTRTLGATPHWSEAPQAPRSDAANDRAVMESNPWTYEVMGKELQREGRSVFGTAPGVDQVVDARQHLYLRNGDPAQAQLLKDGSLPVALDDGRVVHATLPPRGRQLVMPSAIHEGIAVPLPHTVMPEQVVGVANAPGTVVALDRAYQPRTLPVVSAEDSAKLTWDPIPPTDGGKGGRTAVFGAALLGSGYYNYTRTN
jgi:hypothetical protein